MDNEGSKKFDLDEVQKEYDLKVTLLGIELEVKEPTLAQIAELSKAESFKDDELFGFLKKFASNVLPTATAEQLDSLSIRQIKILAERAIKESASDPTDAAPAS